MKVDFFQYKKATILSAPDTWVKRIKIHNFMHIVVEYNGSLNGWQLAKMKKEYS